jgi:flagellar biosynthetic protein FlhB
MAEGDDKTEQATPKRREEAFDNGSFPRSHDLSTAILMLTGIITLHFTGERIVSGLSDLLKIFLGNAFSTQPNDAFPNARNIILPRLVSMMFPLLATMFITAALVNLVQTGWRPNMTRLIPKVSRLSPANGFARLFGGQGKFASGMNALKLVVVAGIAVQRFMHHWPTIVAMAGIAFPENMQIAFAMIYDVALRCTVALVILAAGDWIYQKYHFEHNIRMSKQDVKEEARSMEGDPETKQRRRSLARRMLLQRIQTDVPKADVVITNPTELAIAIKYDPDKNKAPRVVSKGADFLAMRIRQIAIQNGVPIIERKPLAQALYKSVEVGKEVPPQFYGAIAEILAYVYELSGKGRQIKKSA